MSWYILSEDAGSVNCLMRLKPGEVNFSNQLDTQTTADSVCRAR